MTIFSLQDLWNGFDLRGVDLFPTSFFRSSVSLFFRFFFIFLLSFLWSWSWSRSRFLFFRGSFSILLFDLFCGWIGLCGFLYFRFLFLLWSRGFISSWWYNFLILGCFLILGGIILHSFWLLLTFILLRFLSQFSVLLLFFGHLSLNLFHNYLLRFLRQLTEFLHSLWSFKIKIAHLSYIYFQK